MDVRSWRLKSTPVLKEYNIYNGRGHNIGIQMERKELTKIIMMISNWKKTFGLHGL